MMINKILSMLSLVTIGVIIWGEYILLHGLFVSALSGSIHYLVAYLSVFIVLFLLFAFTDIIIFTLLFGTAIALWDE